MSSDPLLNKMDALLKKHRGETGPQVTPTADLPGGGDSPPPLPDDAWLPVLTDVVAVGEPSPTALAQPSIEAATPPQASATILPDVLAEQIMGELEPRLSAMLHDRLAAEIRNNLDDTLSALLAQMDVHIREIVRETIAEHLSRS